MGWGRLENTKIEKIEREDLVDYLLEGRKKEESMENLISELRRKLRKGGNNASSKA